MLHKSSDKLKEHLKTNQIDGLVISSHSQITYLTGYSNFSVFEREAYIFISKNKKFILTDRRYSEAIKKLVKDFELLEITSETPISKLLEQFLRSEKIKKLGVEEDNLTIKEYKLFSKYIKNITHIDTSSLRIIKNTQEIELIQAACDLGDRAFKYALKKIKRGMCEHQLAFEIEFFIKKNGGELSFPTIVAYGANSSIPHHQTGDSKLSKKGEFVLIDMGVKLNNYCSDMTRTIFFGNPSQVQQKIYHTVSKAQKAAAGFIQENLKKGKAIKASEVDKVAREVIIKNGFDSIPHSLGHGIGIEVHESPHLSPFSKDILKSGMVFSIEPGIYIPDFGGVRIEDLFVIEGNNIRQLTSFPATIFSC